MPGSMAVVLLWIGGLALAAQATDQLFSPRPLVAVAFERYPGYDGSLNVSGQVFIGDHVSRGIRTVHATFEGVDTLCDGAQSGANNECGIHIHEGTDCSDARGHQYDRDALGDNDPWQTITYTANSEGATEVSDVMVATGLAINASNGRVFVVHDSTGGRVACAKVQEVAFSTGFSFAVYSFDSYPGYTGDLAVDGLALIQQQAGANAQILRYQWFGGDPTCTADFTVTQSNGCGIHLHEGMTCAQAGGHLYDADSLDADPWATVRYIYTGEGGQSLSTSGVTVPITTGLAKDATLSRTVVVHDATGVRIACGTIPHDADSLAAPLETEAFAKLAGYQGDLAVSGMVKIGQVGSLSQVLSVSLQGVDLACDGTQTGVNNECGIHVHAGLSCSDPLGHYYGDDLAEDPWQAITYRASPEGAAEIPSLTVTTDLPLYTLKERVFVVHDSTGAMAACAALVPSADAATLEVGAFVRYAGYGGSLNVAGFVDIWQVGARGQSLKYALAGADPRCFAYDVNADTPNACGIHIHSGTACSEGAGPHHFDGDVDPWGHIRYVAPGFAGITFSVGTLLGKADIVGRTVVVHDADGARVACGLIMDTAAPSPTPPSGPNTMLLVRIAFLIVLAMGGVWFYHLTSQRAAAAQSQQERQGQQEEAAGQKAVELVEI